jgi:hypothetical protein
LETKSSGLFLQTTKQVIAVFLFVVAFAGVTVLLAVFEHSIDYSGELVCDSFYGRWRIKSCFESATERTDCTTAFDSRLSAKPQNVSGTVMAFAGLAG